jgi:hypothetical protein
MFRAQTACARDIVLRKLASETPAGKILIESWGMSSVSTSRKLGIAARVAGRLISQHARRTRTFGAVTKAARATASHFGRVLGQLWLEVTGFVFLFLAGIGVIAFFREYAKYQAGHATSSRVLLAVCFAGLFGWFGVSSFWRVWKKT